MHSFSANQKHANFFIYIYILLRIIKSLVKSWETLIACVQRQMRFIKGSIIFFVETIICSLTKNLLELTMLRHVASSTLPKLCADAEWSTVYDKTCTTIQTRRGPALQIKKILQLLISQLQRLNSISAKNYPLTHPARNFHCSLLITFLLDR